MRWRATMRSGKCCCNSVKSVHLLAMHLRLSLMKFLTWQRCETSLRSRDGVLRWASPPKIITPSPCPGWKLSKGCSPFSTKQEARRRLSIPALNSKQKVSGGPDNEGEDEEELEVEEEALEEEEASADGGEEKKGSMPRR